MHNIIEVRQAVLVLEEDVDVLLIKLVDLGFQVSHFGDKLRLYALLLHVFLSLLYPLIFHGRELFFHFLQLNAQIIPHP